MINISDKVCKTHDTSELSDISPTVIHASKTMVHKILGSISNLILSGTLCGGS
jgi:hypothetical protein